MNTNDPALKKLAESLASLAQSGEPSQLREYLSGRKLPAIGGDLDPAEVITRAVAFHPLEVRKGLARLLAPLISEETAKLSSTKEERLSRKPSSTLLNALNLAAELPADAGLFGALQELEDHIPDDQHDAWLPLQQALIYQQIDDTLEPAWFSILRPTEPKPWNSMRRTSLLAAWRGLLWIPPSPEEWESGEIINFFRLSRGLGAIYSEVSSQGEDGLSLLQACLEILSETYPRSGEFWADSFSSFFNEWPDELAEIVSLRWPVSGVRRSSEEASLALKAAADSLDSLANLETSMEILRKISKEIEEGLSRTIPSESNFARLHRDLDLIYRQWDKLLQQQNSLLDANELLAASESEEIEIFQQRQMQIDSLIESLRKAG